MARHTSGKAGLMVPESHSPALWNLGLPFPYSKMKEMGWVHDSQSLVYRLGPVIKIVSNPR